MRLTDEEIDANLTELKKRLAASEFFGVVNKDTLLTMFMALKQSRADIASLQDQLRTLRENRFHASSYLDCSERLKIACEALQWLREQGAKVWRRPSVYPQTIGYERSPAEWAIDEAIEKIGEVKSPKQALEKGNG